MHRRWDDAADDLPQRLRLEDYGRRLRKCEPFWLKKNNILIDKAKRNVKSTLRVNSNRQKGEAMLQYNESGCCSRQAPYNLFREGFRLRI